MAALTTDPSRHQPSRANGSDQVEPRINEITGQLDKSLNQVDGLEAAVIDKVRENEVLQRNLADQRLLAQLQAYQLLLLISYCG